MLAGSMGGLEDSSCLLLSVRVLQEHLKNTASPFFLLMGLTAVLEATMNVNPMSWWSPWVSLRLESTIQKLIDGP